MDNQKFAVLLIGCVLVGAFGSQLVNCGPEKPAALSPELVQQPELTPVWKRALARVEEKRLEPVQPLVAVDVEPAPTNSTGIDLERVATDPVYRLEVVRQLKIKSYEKSPAKDTPECQQVVALLKQDDLGLDAVMGAYNVAWENKRALEHLAAFPEEQKAEAGPTFFRMFTERAVADFKSHHPTVSDQTIAELLKITPTVFFGQEQEFMFDPQ